MTKTVGKGSDCVEGVEVDVWFGVVRLFIGIAGAPEFGSVKKG